MQSSKTINTREFIKYKFLNSLFFGISVGSIFVLYTPLEPSIYSIGGIILALGMLGVAKVYTKIITIEYFYKISIFVELVVLFLIVYFLIFNYSYITAFLIYSGYQLTFVFGSYLVRAETIFLKKSKKLSFIDVAKQQGYLFGMIVSYLFYKLLELGFEVTNKQIQVYDIHILLLFIQLITLYFLYKAFVVKTNDKIE
ncbi:MAG: hypothetical protein U9R37_07265 [Campylobacterota bacterium]|nr:hypothetical protein [Campylobacterota bacterium]